VLKLKIENPGEYYENGVYADVKLKGGDGKGCRATIIVSNNEVVGTIVTNGGDGYSTQLFDPAKGFKYPNFLYVKKGKFGKVNYNADELLETVDLKKKIVRKLEKQKIKGDGMLLSVAEIGASAESGGQNTGAFEVDLDSQGRIRNKNLNKGAIGRVQVSSRGNGYPNGTYTDVPLGNGAVGNIVIAGGQLQNVVITDGGDGFAQGDGIEINIPPGTGAAVEVTEAKGKFITDLGKGQDAGGGNNTDSFSGGTIDGSGLGDGIGDVGDTSIGKNINIGTGTGLGGDGTGAGTGAGTGVGVGVGVGGGSGNVGSTGVGSGTGAGTGLSQNSLSGDGTGIVGSGLNGDGGTGQASGGGFGTGTTLSGGGINGGTGIGSGNNIGNGVGQGGVPGEEGV